MNDSSRLEQRSMSVAPSGSIHEHMTRLRMKIVQQKLAAEKGNQTTQGEFGDENELAYLRTDKLRYHQSTLRRQELLQRLRDQQVQQNIKPASPEPVRPGSRHPPPVHPESRESSPAQKSRLFHLAQQPVEESYDSADQQSHQRSHTKHMLPPMQNHALPSIYGHQPAIAGQPIITQPHIVTQPQPLLVPTNSGPVIHHLAAPNVMPNLSLMGGGGAPVGTTINLTADTSRNHPPLNDSGGSRNRGATIKVTSSPPWILASNDYMDMMMMQNCQMHQYVMQQMMLHSMPTPQPHPRTAPAALQSQPIVINTESAPFQPQVISMPKRSSSVHHHHYRTTQLPPIQQPPIVQHVQTVPLMERRPLTKYVYPADVQPLRHPKVKPRPKPSPAPPPTPSPLIPEPQMERKHPFPGPRPLRKLRHIFYAAWFAAFLRVAAKKRRAGRGKTSDKFLFGIQLKEAIAALHRIYLNDGGQIYPILRDVVAEGAIDLTMSFDGQTKPLQELIYILENLTFHITDIMPNAGILGTHRKAAVYEMIQNGKTFPDGYFWQVDRDMMTLDANDKTISVNDSQAYTLLIGLFLSRSLVTTLLMKPLDYGLSTTILDNVGEENLRLLASVYLYLIRVAIVPKGSRMMPLPIEVSQSLYADDELKPLISKIGKTVDYVTELLREWGKEYISRLRAAR